MKRATLSKLNAFILTFIVTAFLFSPVLAQEEPLVLSVEKAKELAEKNNWQLAVDDLEIQTKFNALEKAREDAKILQYSYGTTDNMLDMSLAREVKPIEAETAYEAAKLNKGKNLERLKTDVEKAIYEILLLRKQLELENYRYQVLQERYRIMQVKFSQNIVTESDLDNMKFSVDSKNMDIGSLKDSIAAAELKLKNLIGLRLDGAPLELSAEIKYEPYRNISIDELVKIGIRNNVEIYRLGRNVLAREKEMEVVGRFRSLTSGRYDESRYAYEKALADLETAEANLEVNIRNAFNELLTLEDKVNLAVSREELLKKKLEIAKTKLGTGMMSREQYLAEEQVYMESVFGTLKAKYDYTMRQLEFQVLVR